ncbi:cytochrome P450 [Thozetella sp. PMI_491]|nr:cytochrome P450 [Thozetella sp. PMI_491]
MLSLLFFGALLSEFRLWYRLRHIPGPFFAGFSLLWVVRKCIHGKAHVEFQKLAERYGPVVRIGPNEVLCSDPNSLATIQGVRSAYTKSSWYNVGIIELDHRNVFALQDPEERKDRRKKISPAYSGYGSDGLEQAIDKSIQAWVDLIERKYISTDTCFRPMELSTRAQFFSLDAIGELTLSKPVGFLANDKDMYDMVQINLSMFKIIHLLSNWAAFSILLFRWPFTYLLPRDGDKAGFGALLGTIKPLIRERITPSSKPTRDMLQSFIDHGLTADELRQEVATVFIAGSDTTASTIRMIILSLLSNPAAYRRMMEELEGAIADGRVSTPIRDAEAKSLPYLQAAILETLRTYPSTPAGAFYKQVPPGGDTVNGYFLPAGTLVCTQSVYAMGRSKAFWGDDADLFRPERWLEAEGDEARRQAMQRRIDLGFGYGQFQCLGKGIALMEISKVIPELLRRYDFALVNPATPANMYAAIVWIVQDMWVKVTRR